MILILLAACGSSAESVGGSTGSTGPSFGPMSVPHIAEREQAYCFTSVPGVAMCDAALTHAHAHETTIAWADGATVFGRVDGVIEEHETGPVDQVWAYADGVAWERDGTVVLGDHVVEGTGLVGTRDGVVVQTDTGPVWLDPDGPLDLDLPGPLGLAVWHVDALAVTWTEGDTGHAGVWRPGELIRGPSGVETDFVGFAGSRGLAVSTGSGVATWSDDELVPLVATDGWRPVGAARPSTEDDDLVAWAERLPDGVHRGAVTRLSNRAYAPCEEVVDGLRALDFGVDLYVDGGDGVTAVCPPGATSAVYPEPVWLLREPAVLP